MINKSKINSKQKIQKENIPKKECFFLIVAETTLRQCAKYRVWQRKEQLENLGWFVEVIDWRKIEEIKNALQKCNQVIFYRVPAFEAVEVLLQEVKNLKLSPFWDVDDLIFSKEYFIHSSKTKPFLTAEELEQELWGIGLFRRCMMACGKATASTRMLARAMREEGIQQVAVIENALDQETQGIVESIYNAAWQKDHGFEEIRIIYGSGTKTHDADFRVAAAGLVAAMQAESRLTLHIIGELTVPPECDSVRDRIVLVEGQSYAEYMRLFSQADITIAPLESGVFNNCKSNIKFLEAAILEIPIVCSPANAYLTVVKNGENALLATSVEEWTRCLLALAHDTQLRNRLKNAAKRTVLAHYAPKVITQTQVLPVFGRPKVK